MLHEQEMKFISRANFFKYQNQNWMRQENRFFINSPFSVFGKRIHPEIVLSAVSTG